MKPLQRPPTLLVGIGSEHGGDQLGWQVARAIAPLELAGLEVRIAAKPFDLLDWLGNCKSLHVCDACLDATGDADRSSGETKRGRIHRWEWPDLPVEPLSWSGTHDFGLVGALQLAAELAWLPPQVIVWGMAVDCHDLDDATVRLVEVICQELRD